ncbi:LacI family transcriptional regulator [Pseudonocardia hierapolitana]|uniref:LacI family transcriptional regulator n=1 Tax=Pseudonocardia hierapolitana TaxID=1128676 RepID=A0A561SIY5_9PSEU|nr:LacI family DNA-binding transcriptional regulator [Pseudonocardia hierapolitana]TWF74833.1 LacI family transcriptional regulator [Pseudonocardia hierapolitana]
MPPRRPTQRDIAERAGVSTATVSYVLSGRRGGAKPPPPETRERVLRAVAETGYQLDHAARSLRRQRTDVVALMYPAPSSPWSDRLAEELQVAAAGRGFAVVALPVITGASTAAILRVLKQRYIDGAVLLPDCPLDGAELAALAAQGCSLVVFDDDLEPGGFDVVRQDRASACRAAVERLIGAGHRRVAFLAHADEHGGALADVKMRSYTDGLVAHGIAVDPELVRPVADSRSDAYAAVRDLLRRPEPPTALLSATDRAAVDGIWAARDLGVAVPDQLAVIGIGNIPEGLMISPALTTVGAAALDFSREVARLFERLDASAPLPGVELAATWELITRASG